MPVDSQYSRPGSITFCRSQGTLLFIGLTISLTLKYGEQLKKNKHQVLLLYIYLLGIIKLFSCALLRVNYDYTFY